MERRVFGRRDVADALLLRQVGRLLHDRRRQRALIRKDLRNDGAAGMLAHLLDEAARRVVRHRDDLRARPRGADQPGADFPVSGVSLLAEFTDDQVVPFSRLLDQLGNLFGRVLQVVVHRYDPFPARLTETAKICCVLAAVALPKFVNVDDDAKQAAVNGVAGALSSASAINYASRKAKGESGSAATNKTVVVAKCSDVVGALQAPLPTGFSVTTDSAAGPDVTVSTCVLTGNSKTATFTVTGTNL